VQEANVKPINNEYRLRHLAWMYENYLTSKRLCKRIAWYLTPQIISLKDLNFLKLPASKHKNYILRLDN